MHNYFETNDKKDCNGCGTCVIRCPKNAITMEEDGEGFLYPVINKEKCIDCGLCKKICPNKDYNIVNKSTTYIAINKSKDELNMSSSGGVFILLAKHIIEKNGVVFGVKYNDELIAIHDYTEDMEGLKKFQGSKYVRSDLNGSYQKAERFLKEDKYVLFTGTPCQCQGLRAYLGKDYERLITCEIICHSNPSPKVFEYYKKNLELKKGMKVKEIYFRSKKNGWKDQTPIIKYANGEEKSDIYFRQGFIAELINRPSCYNCHFCTEQRFSDFSIGDMWGIEKIDETIEDNDTGISLFNVNTEKGRDIVKQIKNDLFLKEVNSTLAFSYNHHKNVEKHKKREEFFKGISNGTINETNVIDYMKKYTKKPLYRKVLSKAKRIIKK